MTLIQKMVSRQLLKPVITDVIYKGMHFVIMDSPTADTAQNFAKECSRLRVSDIIRVCEDKYPVEPFENLGISVHHWEFDDGSLPPDDILEKWFELLRLRFYGPKRTPAGDGNGDDNSLPGPVAVHCLAGYGRAPVLVAVALLELGMTNQNAIELIRSKRKGAFNDRQVDYLRNYRAHGRLRRDQHHCRLL
uniref:Protein tyrosine phosphatase type IVA 3 n=1 Tax=Mesocestoides corti TaxID=53468 RepID=A0A5K3FE27_MESCO